MAFNKVGLNLSVLNNLTPPGYDDLNISTTAEGIINDIPAKANSVTNNFYGLGIMLTLFFYLVYKLGNFVEFQGQPFSTIRSVGISAGIVSMIGVNMLSIGYFTEYYHAVIFMGVLLVSTLWVWIEDKR